jgi:uncharacterized protein YkwD
VIVDQVRCRTVTQDGVTRSVCKIQRKRIARAPGKPFFDLDRDVGAPVPLKPEDVSPPLTAKELPAPVPREAMPRPVPREAVPAPRYRHRHEAELPQTELDIPAAPRRPAPPAVKPTPAPAPAPQKPAPIPSDTGAALGRQEARALALLNAERQRRGMQALRLDPGVTAEARAHSRDMCRRRYFSHASPEGKQAWHRLRAAGVRFTAAAENIAVGYATGSSVHQGWLASPGHRANRLNPSYTRYGIGVHVCPGPVPMPYWTEVFVR